MWACSSPSLFYAQLYENSLLNATSNIFYFLTYMPTRPYNDFQEATLRTLVTIPNLSQHNNIKDLHFPYQLVGSVPLYLRALPFLCDSPTHNNLSLFLAIQCFCGLAFLSYLVVTLLYPICLSPTLISHQMHD